MIPFPGCDEPFLLCDFPGLGFGKTTQREQNMGQLMLIQAGKEVSLVLAVIFCFI